MLKAEEVTSLSLAIVQTPGTGYMGNSLKKVLHLKELSRQI
jgi:hypothetical protein